jgi:Ca2+-binding EF-hand superfamily protein
VLCRFERELKDKLQQKSNAKLSEEACLVKMFKYFDVRDRGCVDLDEFCRVLEKSGMYYPREQLEPLFRQYDQDGSGNLDYKEFACIVFGEEVNRAATVKQVKVEPQT